VAADLVLGFVAGMVIATITAPVGVSGAVFLLPVQMAFLGVPNPAVTPTNLLYNVVAGPGALLRYHHGGRLFGRLTWLLLAGTVPGVVAGAAIRVYLLPGPRLFHAVAGLVLLALGSWLVRRTLSPSVRRPVTTPALVLLASGVGVVGGVYGIGGGSILSPLLVGSGMTVAVVAPAALASTFVTSLIGAATFALLALVTRGTIAPEWRIGIACGLGGLLGGYLGALLQPFMPERGLRLLLGSLASIVGALYLVEALT
jgi:uncharacterized membrane protein YfcA